jgi:hypothetical protein
MGLKADSGANEPDASYYSEAAQRRKTKNKKGCFHSPFFSDNRLRLSSMYRPAPRP